MGRKRFGINEIPVIPAPANSPTDSENNLKMSPPKLNQIPTMSARQSASQIARTSAQPSTGTRTPTSQTPSTGTESSEGTSQGSAGPTFSPTQETVSTLSPARNLSPVKEPSYKNISRNPNKKIVTISRINKNRTNVLNLIQKFKKSLKMKTKCKKINNGNSDNVKDIKLYYRKNNDIVKYFRCELEDAKKYVNNMQKILRKNTKLINKKITEFKKLNKMSLNKYFSEQRRIVLNAVKSKKAKTM